jgi:hypothetical protein
MRIFFTGIVSYGENPRPIGNPGRSAGGCARVFKTSTAGICGQFATKQ